MIIVISTTAKFNRATKILQNDIRTKKNNTKSHRPILLVKSQRYLRILISLLLLTSTQVSYAYNFCQSQPSGGDIGWDLEDDGNKLIPFTFTAGDVWSNVEKMNSATIRGHHQYTGDMAAELLPPGGTAQAQGGGTADSVILFRLGDARYGEGASGCNFGDFDMTFRDDSVLDDLSVANETDHCKEVAGVNTDRSGENSATAWDPQPYLPNVPAVTTIPTISSPDTGDILTYNSQGFTGNFLANLEGIDPLPLTGEPWNLYVEDAYAQDVGTVTEACIDLDFGSVTYDIWVSKNATCTDRVETETFGAGENVYLCYETSNQATQDFTFQSETNNHGVNLSADFTGTYDDNYSVGGTKIRTAYRTFIAGSASLPIGNNTFTGNVIIEGSDTFFSTGETLTTDESVVITVTPTVVELKITKTVNIATPNIGDTVTFSILVENSGPIRAIDVSVTDIVPAGFTYVTNSMTGIPPAGGIAGVQSTPETAPGLSWTIDALNAAPAAGSSTALTFQAVVNAP